jgi:Ca2+-binding RTX toxin-like protein
MAGSLSLDDGVVRIIGTNVADAAVVTYDDRGTLLHINDDRVIVSLTHAGERHVAAYNVRRQVFNLLTRDFDWVTNVTGLYFSGGAGNDTFRNDSSLPATALGHSGNDHLVGGSGADMLDGGFDNDNLEGRDGSDWLEGGDDNDTAFGGAGNDRLEGGAGNDWLLGGTGNDGLYGELGRDVLAGEAGDDYLDGGEDGAADILWGGGGADRFVVEFFWLGGDWVPRDRFEDFRPGEGDRRNFW